MLTVDGGDVLGLSFRLEHLLVATDELCRSAEHADSYLCKPQLFRTNADYFLRMHASEDYVRGEPSPLPSQAGR